MATYEYAITDILGTAEENVDTSGFFFPPFFPPKQKRVRLIARRTVCWRGAQLDVVGLKLESDVESQPLAVT